jgi:class 3 adenylate cyclase
VAGGTVAGTESVTILFTDLVDSTAIASELTVEASNELRRAHFSVLRQAIVASGGTEVKNLGDGVMVAFASTVAGLACAVAMQQAIDRNNRKTGQSQGIRVGLSCGEATREGNDFFGDPVVEAARLCARAERSQILVSDVVRAMAGRRSPHGFHSVGPLALKGIPDPVESYEVAWQPLDDIANATHGIPLPSRLSLAPSTGVIGRNQEAALLSDACKRASSGDGREVVLIAGEPGVGKTTVAAQIARVAFEAGACVLLGRCDEEMGAPYGPFLEALHHYVSHIPEEVLWEHVRTYGSELSRLLPALRDRLGKLPPTQSTDPDTERYLLFEAAIGLLARASTSYPVVLVLDDLQWADKPTLQLLRQLISSDKPKRLLVVCTYRDSELLASQPVTETLVAIRREPGVSRIQLKGLDDAEVLGFVEAAAGHDLDEDGVGLAQAVYRETDGNPFFVGELLRHLVEVGSIQQDEAGRWRGTGSVEDMVLPDSVVQVIGSRVDRLGEGAKRVLCLASVIGREFELDLLAHASERSEDDVIDILDGAGVTDLVYEVSDAPGRFTFSHALIQRTLYQDMGATRRVRAHRRVAEAIEDLCGANTTGRVGELAHHWASATQPVDTSKAVSYAHQAADAALAALAPDEAVRYFTQALHFLGLQSRPDALLGVQLLIGLGTAQRQSGMPDFRSTFLDAAGRARRQGFREELIAAALGNNRGLVSAIGAIDIERVELLESALELVPSGETAERALLLATLSAELSYQRPLDERRALAEEAMAIARRAGDLACVVKVTTLVTHPLNVPWLLELRTQNSMEALAAAQHLGDPVLHFISAGFCHMNALQGANFDLADECIATMRALSDRLRQPPLMFSLALTEGSRALIAGDPERAEHFANTALEIGNSSGQPDAFLIYGTQLMLARYQQNRLGELVTLIEQVAADNTGVPAFSAALAIALLQSGDHDRAASIMKEYAADDFRTVREDAQWLLTVLIYAAIAVELEIGAPAQILIDLLAPFHDQVPYNTVIAAEPVAYFLGGLARVCGRYEEAARYFAEAADIAARGDMTFARARVEAGLSSVPGFSVPESSWP